MNDSAPREVIVSALARLLEEGVIWLYRGPSTSTNLVPVSKDRALTMLRNPRWLTYGDDPDEERLFYVNVENVKQ
jgi:hypothetical protein